MTATSATDPIADLWREARAWLAAAMHDFRGPVDVAKTLARKARAAIRRRLALIESLLMKLLLIEAARLPLHPFPGRRAAASPGPINTNGAERPLAAADAKIETHESKGRACAAEAASARRRPGLGVSRQSGNGCREDSANSATWRVRFHARLPRDTKRERSLGASPVVTHAPCERIAHEKARRLARRFEALRRVIADPRRAIAALARKLTALGKAAYAAARRIARAHPRRCASLGDAHATAIVLAHDSCAAFRRDTS